MDKQNTYSAETAKSTLNSLRNEDEKVHALRGEKMALELFQQMSSRVPAYKDFLKKHNINPAKIKTISDFHQIPFTDKENYLRQYPREMLVWDGDFKNQNWIISTTSGSTGKPYYFPRQSAQDEQYALLADMYLRTNFRVHERSTLYIVAFPMGAWIGGLFTYEAIQTIAETRGYPLSVITPGIHKTEILNAVKELGSSFDQVIIGSYAPFLKDFIEDGEKQGINWKELKLGFIFSAEVFSETFRDYVQKKTGIEDIHIDTLNHYGTVDLGTMAHETPISICVRRQAIDNLNLFEQLFNQTSHLPTLAQYIPELFYFETVNDGDLLCSANSGIPLARYDLKDRGGTITQKNLKSILQENGFDFDELVEDNNLSDTVWQLPYVYVYERSDFSVSYYAFQIYPETVRKALQAETLIEKVTSKFTMRVKYNDKGRQILEIDVECAGGQNPSQQLKNVIEELITEQLITDNSEYRETHLHYGDKIRPIIKLWEYEHPKHFKVGTKQRWVERKMKSNE